MTQPPPRIALLGGSFDPIHAAHLRLADAVHAHLAPDELCWVPAAQSPFKADGSHAAAADRLALLRLAVAGRPRERILTCELERPGPSWTVDTLRALAAERAPARFALIVGADTLIGMPRWREIETVLALAEVHYAPRPADSSAAQDALDAPAEAVAALRAQAPDAVVEPLPMEPIELSSTTLRAQLGRGEDPGAALPPGVLDEIRRRGLYRAAAD